MYLFVIRVFLIGIFIEDQYEKFSSCYDETILMIVILQWLNVHILHPCWLSVYLSIDECLDLSCYLFLYDRKKAYEGVHLHIPMSEEAWLLLKFQILAA